MNIERNFRWAAALAIAAVIVAACGGEPAAAPTQAPSAGDEPASATTTAGGQSAAAAEAEATQPAADEAGTRDIGDLDSNLASLKSYRMRFAYTFEGKDKDGKEQKGRIEFLQEYIAETKEQHIRMSGMGSGAGEAIEFFRVGDVTYIYSAASEGDQKCSSFSTSDSASMTELMKPGDILGGLNDARLAEKGVTVNGVVADRYVFDETNVGFGGFTAATGEAWVSQDGAYLVKYVGKATGKAGLFGSDAEGAIGWEYNLEDINALGQIALPPECVAAAPADDIPVPPSATDKTQFGAMLTFKTKDALADVVAFYRAELPAQGWTEVVEEGAGVENMATLNFTKEKRQLSILITADEDGTNVLITETKADE